MNSGAQYVVLCEDLQSQVFIRRALARSGANPRRITFAALPSESEGGAGEKYVREHYARRVKAHRVQAASMRAALIVHIDVDPGNSVAYRQQQLAEELAKVGEPPRSSEERIAHLIPKQNIETWIHFYLDGPPIDEEREYPKYRKNESACWPAADAFADDALSGVARPEAPPALVQGLSEYRRIL